MKFELNRVYNENCIDTMGRMPDKFVDMVLTSPPYDNRRKYENCKFDFNMFKLIAKELTRVIKENGVIIYVVADEHKNFCESLTSFKQAIYFVENCKLNLTDTMIYLKKSTPSIFPSVSNHRYNPSFEYMFVFCKGKPKTFNPLYNKCINSGKVNNHCSKRLTNNLLKKSKIFTTLDKKIKGNVWEFVPNDNSDNLENGSIHPAVFPKQLVIDHIKSWSNEGDIVYDPFGGCYDYKTEILTNRGWILFKHLKKDDKVASLENEELKFVNYSNFISYKYKGKMINFKGREIDLVVTPNHNMFISKRKTYNKNIKKIKNRFTLYYDDYQFEKAENTKTLSKVKRVSDKYIGYYTKINSFNNMNIKYWLMFLGFYLGDGYFSKCKNSYGRVGFHLKKNRKKEYINKIMKYFPIEWNTSGNKNGKGYIRYYTSNHEIVDYFKTFGNCFNKFIPDNIKQLPKKYLKYLFDGLINSDGCIDNCTKRITYYSSNKKLIDDVMEICLKLGKPCIITQRKRNRKYVYCLYISSLKEARLHKKKDIKYNNFVYCITVPSHVLLIRRNGKPCFCGNSGTVGKVCQLLKRNFILSEISKNYCDLTNKTLKRTNMKEKGSWLWL